MKERPGPSDAEFWRAATHDPDAFGELFTGHARAVHAYCAGRSADLALADDLTSVVFWRLASTAASGPGRRQRPAMAPGGGCQRGRASRASLTVPSAGDGMLALVAERGDPDWTVWHAEYDLPGSRLERRLGQVKGLLDRALSSSGPGSIRLVSACAGEGRDVLGVLPDHPRRRDVRALLVEADPGIAAGTAGRARLLGLEVTVQVGDAGQAGAYLPMVPAHVALFCGVFGNITPQDVAGTIGKLATLLAPGARVLWTRGRDQAEDLTGDIRRWFHAAGFVEEAFVAPEDEDYLAGRSSFTVGMHRLVTEALPYDPDTRLFHFIGYRRVRGRSD